MQNQLNRRELIRGSVAFAAVALAQPPFALFGADREEGEWIPFLDVQPAGKMLRWSDLNSWTTANKDLFAVSHYGQPQIDATKWQLEVGGLVNKPKSLNLADLRARPRTRITAILECSGNSSNPGFMGAIGNVEWTGTRLGPVLRDCSPSKRAIEAVFFGADQKTEKIREKDYVQNFARSLSLPDAFRDEVLLAYEMNGQPLTPEHGAPVRLVVPGWFGIAWIKWLTRIELLDRRYMSKYMAREYVTIRGEERPDGSTVWRETSVGPIDVKSVTARAVRLKNGTVRFQGAAWTDGTPLVQVQFKIDDQSWRSSELEPARRSKYGWRFWTYDWRNPAPGEHTVVSRAIDAEGRVQPAKEESPISLKRTYWEANQQWPRKIRI